jgi:hypothetical protein
MSDLSRLTRVEEWCQKVWEHEQAEMRRLDYKESEVRVATVHTLKQALQIPPGMGAIYGCLSTIRATLVIIALLLVAITYRLYVR